MNGDIHNKLPGINVNTYVSIGVIVILCGGFWAVINSIYAAKVELTMRTERLELRLTAIESMKKESETWNDRDMFKWTVHLQRDNPNLKVPEPVMGNR